MSQDFTVARGALKIKGKVYRPEEEGIYPAIIISHEFGASTASSGRYARELYKDGYAVFVFDFCGGGVGKSSGRSVDMSVQTEKEDLMAVMDYVLAQDFVDPEDLTLMGCSQGGLVSALAAAERPEQVSKLILFYPALCIPDDARKGTILDARIDPENIPKHFQAMKYMRLGPKYVRDAMALDPWREICRYEGPVLIVHGKADGMVPCAWSIRAYGEYKDCKLVLLNGAHHGFLGRGFRSAVKAARRFLNKHSEK